MQYSKHSLTTKNKRHSRAQDRQQFLPAAIQLESSPAPVYGRLILWTILLLVVIAVAWAYLGRIDIVAVAPGKIVPLGKVKQIQSFDRAVVQQIHVHEGQAVSMGDPLVSFDSTFSGADQQQAIEDLQDAQSLWLIEFAYNQHLQGKSDDDVPAAALLSTAMAQLELNPQHYPQLIDQQFLASRLSNRIALHRSHLSALRQELQALAGSKQSTEALLTGLQATLPIIRERAESVKGLFHKQLASRDHYLQQEQQRIEAQQRMLSERSRVASLDAQMGQVRARLEGLIQQELERNLVAMNEARLRKVMLQQTLRKAAEQRQRSVLRAPVDGIVQQLQIHTIGGIVSPAQLLMSLTPINERLEVEAFIKNRDIGFVDIGQAGAVKVDAYNFTRYGSIDGTLQTVSSDAIEKEGMGLVYPTIVSLATNSIAVENKNLALSPGMSVSVEIKTGSRRIIEYFLSPLLKMGRESIRER
jgi:hemolysin D